MTDHSSQEAIYTDGDGRALQGYDPVAYFTVGAPTKGDPDISRQWNGATWLFASTANRELFDADPLAYAPAFGGHCAVARAFGASLRGSAKRWRIDDGRLYVNKNLFADLQFPLFVRRIRKRADRAASPADATSPTERLGGEE